MLKLATIIDNPGEPPVETRYRDPRELGELGYNAVAIYQSTALSGLADAEVVGDSELRRWVAHHIERVGQALEQAHEAGLGVYFFYDVLALPTTLVDRSGANLLCKKARPRMLCPASEQAWELSVAALEAALQRWSFVAGVVLRFGDTDAGRLPHLCGNEIYAPRCARCEAINPADRILSTLQRFHTLVVERFNKRLIARAWNVRPNGLHDAPELAEQIAPRLPGEPGDDRFMLSFKHTQTDFWRYQRWNPSSFCFPGRPILYELQCQREFEGKGAMPNWQAPLWRHGQPEAEQAPSGLAGVGQRVNLAGVLGWVRGGGWGGPFVSDETWIDANVFAIPRLADESSIATDELARQWVRQRLGVTDEAIERALMHILESSPEAVRGAFYLGPFARSKDDPWRPAGDWLQDDLLDARAAWRMIQRVPGAQLDELVNEKQAAAEQISALRAELQHLVGDRHHATLERLVNTLIYAESLFETLRDLVAGLVAYRRYQRQRGEPAAQIVRQRLLAAQSHWNHHVQRHGALPGAATSFRETHFWELTQDILAEVGMGGE